MLFSRNLLTKYLPKLKTITNDDLIVACGSIGTEIEKIYKHPKINNLIIGKIIDFSKHPNADKLNVCTIKTKNETLTIVCGAKNVTKDKYVVVALPGCKLHDGREIAKSDIRGVTSNGMLCGYYELTNLNELQISQYDSEGIILLDDVNFNTDPISHLGLDDEIYDISIPFSNRNDLNGLLSFCNEIAGYFRWNFKHPKFVSLKKALSLDITIDENICDLYYLIKANNVEVKESNWEMKSLLMNNNIKPINNIVDKINFITLLTNVPIAIYDYDTIKSENISVCLAKNNEVLHSINQTEIKTDEKDIIVKAGDKIICLAGIVNNVNYSVTSNTKNILIEIAHFNFQYIRNSMLKHNIMTDAAKRFSKPISLASSFLAIGMIKKEFNIVSCKYSLAKEFKDTKISLDYQKINYFIGKKVSKTKISSLLKPFGFTNNILSNKCTIPFWRTDIIFKQDIIEEIVKAMRVNEFEEQPISCSPNIINSPVNNEYFLITKIKNFLINNYFNECNTINTINSDNSNKFNLFDITNITINSSNKNRANLRNNTIFSLLNIYKNNVALKNDLVPIFEIQNIYFFKDQDVVSNLNLTLLTKEILYIDKVNDSKIKFNINGLINIFSTICENILNNNNLKIEKSNINFFYDNENVCIKYNDSIIGYCGKIKKSELSQFNIENEDIYCLSVNIQNLLSNFIVDDEKFNAEVHYNPIIKDITFNYAFDNNVNLSEVIKQIKKLPYVHKCEFIDKFFNETKNTYTISLRLINKKDLTNDMISSYLDEIVSILATNGYKI